MKLRLGSKASQEALEALCRWMPSQASAFRKMAGECPLGIELEVKPVKPKRSIPQNKLYFDIVTALAAYVGLSKAEMHEEVLCDVFGWDLVTFRGWERKVPRCRSSKLTVEQFGPLIETAMRWAAEAGVHWDQEAA